MTDLVTYLENRIKQMKDQDPFADLPPHPHPQLVIDKLISKQNRLTNDLWLERAKRHQLRDYIQSKGLEEDFIAWKVTKRMEGSND
jgi:hypothetical protein